MNTDLALFRPLLGLYPFDAKKGHGSFVTFSLTSAFGTAHEEFYFWIYMCSWKILDSGKELAHSESPDDQIQNAVEKFNQRSLQEIAMHSWITREGIFHGSSLIFERDLCMKLRQYEEAPADDPIFMTRDSMRIWTSYFSDGSIRQENTAEQGAAANP